MHTYQEIKGYILYSLLKHFKLVIQNNEQKVMNANNVMLEQT